MGFWEHTDTMDEDHETGLVYVDYTKQFNIQQMIHSIYCEKIHVNSQIVIEMDNQEQIILRAQNADVFDSAAELVKI